MVLPLGPCLLCVMAGVASAGGANVSPVSGSTVIVGLTAVTLSAAALPPPVRAANRPPTSTASPSTPTIRSVLRCRMCVLIRFGALLKQASMPLQEVDWLTIGRLKLGLAEVKEDVPGAERRAVDWIKFGQLLRAELGWTDYPEWPQEEERPP